MSFEAKVGSTGNAAVVKYAAGRSTRAQRYVQKIGRGVQKESNCRCSWQGFFSLLRAQRAGASLPSEGVMRSTVKEGKSWVSRHTIVISGRKTSVNLEDEFWDGLKEVAVARNMKLHTLVTKIDSKRQHANLSSAVRLFVLDFYQAQIKLSAQRRR